MKTLISFSDDLTNSSEKTLPIVKLTKSKNGETGTATFVFIKPSIFKFSNKQMIKGMYLVWLNKQIVTNDIKIIFKEGKPFLLKAILIFKNSHDWFNFLNFMNAYSKETGLLFSENNSLS